MGDTVWDTVDTTDTDIPVLTDTTTTTARGLLMLNLKPNPKPKLIPPLKRVRILWPSLLRIRVWPKILWWILRTPLWIRIPILLPSAILLKLCFFYEKIVTKLIFGPIVIKNSQKMPLSKKKGTWATTSSVLLSGYDIQLLSEIVILSETVKPK